MPLPTVMRSATPPAVLGGPHPSRPAAARLDLVHDQERTACDRRSRAGPASRSAGGITTPPLPWIGSRRIAAGCPTPPARPSSRSICASATDASASRRRIGERDELGARRHAQTLTVEGLAGEANRADGAPEVPALERDHRSARTADAGDRECDLVGHRTGDGGQHPRRAGRRDRRERFVELGTNGRRVRRRTVHQAARLGAEPPRRRVGAGGRSPPRRTTRRGRCTRGRRRPSIRAPLARSHTNGGSSRNERIPAPSRSRIRATISAAREPASTGAARSVPEAIKP